MRFLVTRMDALHNGPSSRHINNSEAWPCIVECENHAAAPQTAYDTYFRGSSVPLNREFLVVHLVDAEVVSLKPVNNYDVRTRPF